jgi:Tol biopolymer transport system component
VETSAQVAIVNADGTGFAELTAEPGNNPFPSFAPDGKRFVYRTFTEDGYGLRIMNLETKAVTVLTREYEYFPLWSPRGDLILFARLVADFSFHHHLQQDDGSGSQAGQPEAHWPARQLHNTGRTQ